MSLPAVLIAFILFVWFRFITFHPVKTERERYNPAAGFLLHRARWTAQAWIRAIASPGWRRSYQTTICSMIGMVFFADGRTSDDEIAVLKEVLQRHFFSTDPAFQSRVMREMVAAKFSGQGIGVHARRLKKLFNNDEAMLETAVIILLSVAAAEGRVSPGERKLIEEVCQIFEIPFSDFADLVRESGSVFTASDTESAGRERARTEQREWQENYERQTQRDDKARGNRSQQTGSHSSSSYYGASGGGDAGPKDDYAVLNISSTASVAEIKKAFRTLALKYHPDRLRAQGIPANMAERTNKRFREIKDAYERIMERRGGK